MKLSFIVPIYNVEDYLFACCKSILNQVNSTCEVLLVDDGSTDKSSRIADDIAREHDCVTVIHKENGGLASARNAGLDSASGDYVAFVDSDDLISENCLSAVLRELEDTKPDILFLDSCKLYPDGTKKSIGYHIEPGFINQKSKSEVLYYLSRLPKFPDSACMKIYRRAFLFNCGLRFPEDGRVSEDLNFVMNSLLDADTYSALDLNYYEYRQNRAGSITDAVGLKHFQGLQRFIEDAIPVLCDSDYRPKNNECACCLSFVAYEYSIMLWMLCKLAGDQRKNAMEFLKDHRWLMKYAAGNKSRLTRFTLNCFGLRGTSALLDFYMKIR